MSVHLFDDLKVEPAIETQNLAASATVNGGDHNAAAAGSKFREVLCYIDVGLWTDGTHTFKLQDAPDNAGAAGAYADVPAERQVGGASVVVNDAADDNAQHFIGAVIGAGRPWVRVSVTSAGVTTGLAAVEAHMILGDATPRPVR